jgi:dipeptidyl aminopeptidase/acylaminoacyl peptidase
LTFAAERDDVSNIYAVEPRSGAVRLLVTNAQAPSWSPDGRWLAFERGDNVWVRGLTGGRARLLARGSALGSWSADSKAMVFDGLWRVDVEDGRRERLLNPGGLEPVFSPDGQHLAFRRGESFDPAELWVADGDGGHARLVTGVATCSTPTWSPDGRELAVVDEYGASSAFGGRLRIVDVATGQSVEPLRREVTCHRPLWSPDGRELALAVDVANGDISPLIVSTPGFEPNVVESVTGGHPLAWSPTGRTIVVGGSDAALVDVRTQRVSRPTEARRFGYDITGAAWNPTGPRLANLGGRPAALGHLKSDSRAQGNTLVTKHRVGSIAADGANVVILFPAVANCVELWNPRKRILARFDEDSCEGVDNQAVDAVAVAGNRAAWVDSMETLHYDLSVLTATARNPSPKALFTELDAYGHGGLGGAANLLVYVRQRSRGSELLRLGRHARVIRTEPHEMSLLDVAASRIAVREGSHTKVFAANGSPVADIPTRAAAAEVDGDVLAVLHGRELRAYDLRSGRTLLGLALPAGGRLLGLARGVVVYGERGRIVVMRLSDRRRTAVAVPAGSDVNARLTSAGLFYSFPAGIGARVTFRPFASIVKTLG